MPDYHYKCANLYMGVISIKYTTRKYLINVNIHQLTALLILKYTCAHFVKKIPPPKPPAEWIIFTSKLCNYQQVEFNYQQAELSTHIYNIRDNHKFLLCTDINYFDWFTLNKIKSIWVFIGKAQLYFSV